VLKSDGAGEAAPVTESETRQFASTQFDLPVAVAAAVRRLADRIAVTDLAADGKEPSPHITVKYGLHAHDPEAVRRAVAGFGPVAVKLGSISLFPADAYDVVKIDVEGAGLRTLNAAIADACPHTDTHPEYVPHITLAYVLPGRGAKYTGGHELVGQTVLLSNLTFSPASGVPVIIPLTGTPVQESVDDDADLGDPAERAGLIAEILAALHGDDALAAFDDEGNGSSPVAESLAVLMSVPRFATLLEAWDKLQHPRGEHGRFIPRGSAEAVAAVHERVKKALAGDRSPTSARDLADHLSILTVKQLHDLKKSHNISASGPTVDSLRAKIADRLDRGRREPGEKAADTTGAAEPTAPLLAIGDKSAEPAPVAEPATPPVAATPEPPTAPERQADAAAEAGTGDDRKRVGKDGVEYARAPAGGATSPVNGQFYKGGHWMPIHGLSPKVEKGAKGAGGGAPPPPPKDDEGKGTKPGRGPMTPEQIEDERQKREDQKKWDEIGAGPLGQMKWLGNNPNHKAVSHPILHIDRWKEFAAGMGEEKLSALADKIKVAVDAKIDADVAAERAKGNVVPEDNVEWEKNTARTSAEQDASMFGGKKHLKEVPSSYYARQLAQQYIGLHPTVEGLHGLHRMLSDAKASTAAGAAAGAATEPAPALPPSPPESELFKATSGYEPEFKYPAANDALRAAWRGDHGPEVQAAVKGERGPELRTSARSLIADHAHDNPEYLARALAKMAGKAQPPASPPLPPAPTPAKTGGPGAVRATPGPGPQAAVKEQPMSTNVSTSAPPVRQPAHPFTGMNEAAKAQAINDIADPFGKTPGAAPAYREAVGAAYESQPDEVKTQLRQRIAAHVAANAKERSVGPANDVLYQRVAAEVPGLTPQAFVGALHAMRDAGELRLTGWPRPASELPNKDVVAVIGTKPMYYASPPG
jgi:2'-5' RNA ligase